MSSASFGTVNATGLNVSGILQASQVVTTKPIQVSNITATGAVDASMLNVSGTVVASNATVQGNLTVNGKVLQEGFSPVNLRNMTDKIALPINSVYPIGEDMSSLYGSAGVYGRRMPYPTIKPYETTFSVPLRSASNDVPSALLTTNTSWSNPDALDAYGNPAPLIKIENNGSLTYLNVAASSITNLCSNLLPPTTTKSMDFIMYEKNNSWISPVSNNGAFYSVSTGDVVDDMAQIVAGFAKRGFPFPGKQRVKGYNTNLVFYSDTFITGEAGDTPSYFTQAQVPNLGFDLNQFASNSTVTVYLLGGVLDKIALALPSPTIDWSNNIVLTGKTFPVTLSSIQYESNLASNTNVVYYDAATSVMNFNITNFDSYSFTFPADGFSTANVATSTPSFFRGSFGFYRKPVNATSVPVLPRLGNADVTVQEANYLDPVQSDNISNAEFMMQTSSTVTVTYRLSTNPTSNTVVIPRYDTVSSVLYLTAMTLPRYLSSNVDVSIRLRGFGNAALFDFNEHKGFLLTNGTRAGDNENTPYLTETTGISSGFIITPISDVRTGFTAYWGKNFGSLNYKADEVKSIIPPIINQTSESLGFGIAHEFFHNMQWAIGLNADDRKQDIFDDEWLAQLATHMSGKFMKTQQTLDTASFPESTLNRLVKGQYFPYSSLGRNDTTVFANVFSGTNFMAVNDILTTNWNYNLSEMTMNMISSYDPNAQLFKLFMYYAALETKNLNQSDIFRLGYYSTARSVNPSSATSVFSNAIISSNLHYSDGSSITDAGRLHHESAIALANTRNNTNIPTKYRWNFAPTWFKTSYANSYIRSSTIASTSFNQDSWDLIQTNEDIKSGTTVLDTAMPWYPKNITGVFGGKDSWGRTYTVPNGAVAPYTQDCSFAAMANVALTQFTSNVTRHLHSLQSCGYAFSNAINTVTVELATPTIGGSFGTFNSNISVSVFKYVPDRCVTGSTTTIGAYMMAGPFNLSSTGTTTKTIDLNALLVDGVDGATFSNVGSNVTASMASFNTIFPYGIDDETVYVASPAAIANKARLGMTTGYYQPVTRLLVTNEYIDKDFNFTDADILDKLYLLQIKPSAVKISIT
jgi:hypothetical protein